MNDVAANVLALAVALHLAAAPSQQQALHVHVVHTIKAYFTGRVGRALHDQLGGRMHIQTYARGNVGATLDINQPAGIEIAPCFYNLLGLVQGSAADKGTRCRANQNIGIATRPSDALAQHASLRVEGLLQLAARIDPTHQFDSAGTLDGDRAPRATRAQTSACDATCCIHQNRQQIVAAAHADAVPTVVCPRGAASHGHITAGEQPGLQPHLLSRCDRQI